MMMLIFIMMHLQGKNLQFQFFAPLQRGRHSKCNHYFVYVIGEENKQSES